MGIKQKRNTSGLIHKPKLTWEAVRVIRSEYLIGSRRHNLRTLAQRYEVSKNTIHKVVTNQTWKCPEYAKRVEHHPIQAKRNLRLWYRELSRIESARVQLEAVKSDPDLFLAFCKSFFK